MPGARGIGPAISIDHLIKGYCVETENNSSAGCLTISACLWHLSEFVVHCDLLVGIVGQKYPYLLALRARDRPPV